ncbi:OmpW/AlkL family protein [Acinetobacter faecalis]|uniref:OmpW/AlkL family protein n=3 Tax=Acinetobacter faecalis TaxID=2665161 RepID=UPI002A90EBAA|nr:OmpW family outer membrane protein [Acinetobacter faecalis]MDY6451060.1 OmpW family outer membrane protein [Acinetobacter faecalis]MDY6455972.1 OmpW family outer membrane protein [Acinetobacter faecalis]MDY6485307.1 OmpW family outer membrane protein [Acinetobacter faecalis]
MKPSFKTILPIALLGLTAVTATHAETSDGKTFGVSAGWLHVMPQSSEQGVNNQLGNNWNMTDNAGFKVKDADTAGLAFDYFVNDNVSLEMVLGAPPKMKLSGVGRVNLIGNLGVELGDYDNIATTRAYTPTVLAKYQFGTINSKIRPYLGGGLMYAHFSDIKTDPNIALPLGAKIGNVSVDDAIAPVVVAGIDYNINKEWFATASVSYAHLSTDATLTINSSTGSKLVTGKSEIEINPIITYVGLGYRF